MASRLPLCRIPLPAIFALILSGLTLMPFSHSSAQSDKPLSKYMLDTWDHSNGLPGTTISALLQSRDGYLWIGTGNGLARFDGVRFVTFDRKSHPKLLSNRIRTLFEDSRGRLWIGTEGGGVSILANGTLVTRTSDKGIPSGGVWDPTNPPENPRQAGTWPPANPPENKRHAGVWTATNPEPLKGGKPSSEWKPKVTARFDPVALTSLGVSLVLRKALGDDIFGDSGNFNDRAKVNRHKAPAPNFPPPEIPDFLNNLPALEELSMSFRPGTLGSMVVSGKTLYQNSSTEIIETYSVTPQFRALENALVATLMLGLTRSQGTSSLQTSLTAMYRLTQSNRMTLSIRRTGFQGDSQFNPDYSEHTASLTLSQKL